MLVCFAQDDLGYNLPVIWRLPIDNPSGDYLVLSKEDLIFYKNGLRFITATECYTSLLQKKHVSLLQIMKRRGKLPCSIVDGTGGWGRDALTFAQAGINTTLFECQELPIIFLHYALQRWFSSLQSLMTIHNKLFSEHSFTQTECVYLDPLFFDDKKSLSKKTMQSLYDLYPTEKNIQHEDLKKGLLKIKMDTLVIKQPRLTKPWLANWMIHQRFNRTCRFDIFYINKGVISNDDFHPPR